MIAHRIETVVTKEGTLLLEQLPFQPGETVEVIILEKPAAPQNARGNDRELEIWEAASHAALQEIWDNDEDAVYDRL